MPYNQSGLLALVDRQVQSNPQGVAVTFQSQQLTYAQLDQCANRLAHWLRTQGVGPNVLIGLCLERSLDLAVALLATLKVGGAYVPLDPRYPRERLAFMIQDAQVHLLLTHNLAGLGLAEADGQLQIMPPVNQGSPIAVVFQPQTKIASPSSAAKYPQGSQPAFPDLNRESDTPLELAESGEELAYVIYTSGSTGQPKGVAMGRRALANLIAWQVSASQAGLGSRTLQYTPLSFDVHFQEFLGTWASGGTLVLVDDDRRLDPLQLLGYLQEEKIERLFLPFIALQSLAEVAVSRELFPAALREIITAGEQLQVTRDLVEFFAHLPGCTLHNHYGPSETHVVTAYTLGGPPASWQPLPPIGTPLPNVELFLLDEQGQPVPEGEAGELFIAGVALAQGYYRRPELTAERFLLRGGQRLYRTGDLACRRADGIFEFLGRVDGQVKIRGHRVELGEIEVALGNHPDVAKAALAAHDDGPGDRRLAAYLVLRPGCHLDVAAMRLYLAQRLPEFMVPAAFVALSSLPMTPSGKVDRRSLPRPERTRPELAREFVPPRPGLEETLARIWGELLHLDRVGSHDNFFELGGNSLLSVQVLTRLRQESGLEVSIARFFHHPTVAALAAALEESGPDQDRSRLPISTLVQKPCRHLASKSVAIIGMAGRFPGAANVEELWHNLCAGVEGVTFFTEADLDPGIAAWLRRDRRYVMARGFLEGADLFDAGFFGINRREAELMDPQHRVFLEVAWEALENAGWVPESFPGRIGIFAGTHNNSYRDLVARRPDLIAHFGEFATMLVNEKDYLATRTAYALDLHGPALSVNTACSTSLVAVVQAVDSLLAGHCDLALAGGVAITCPQRSGYLYQEGAMLSPDGHTRPFDEQAQGTVFSDGVGIVVLKRLEEALADGDFIHAIIRGAALNNDGSRKMSFTAPAVAGQAEVITLAQELAGVAPETISYVEAHGTATPLGDPVEVEALTLAFRRQTQRRQFCALGSLKSNLGHLVAAAGVAGLIKAALALERQQLPPTVHFHQPNPRIDWAHSPFFVNAELRPWPRGEQPRRAGVSSFGVGGTNAHVVLEEFRDPREPEPSGEEPHILLLSARTPQALAEATRNLAGYLQHCAEPLADVAFTLQVGRKAFTQRRFVVARHVEEAAACLARPEAGPVQTAQADGLRREVVFMFPGQGTQHVHMGQDLYQNEPAFRATVDQCVDLLQPIINCDLREVLYHPTNEKEATAALNQTRLAQPALFTIEYALATLLESWGIRPQALIGHSIGEFVAACLSGVFSLEDGLRLVALRGELMQQMPPGGMLSVRLPAAEVESWLDQRCAIASINSPQLCVASGPDEALLEVQKRCENQGVPCRRLHTSHAFHSPMMEPVVEPLAERVRTLRLSPPRVPILSTVTAEWLTAEQATDPHYWARHLRQTVNFGGAVAALKLSNPLLVLFEVGPRNTLATLARQQFDQSQHQVAVVALEGLPELPAQESIILRHALGRLWLAGVPIDWPRLHRHKCRRLPLPTYPFQRQRYWIDATPAEEAKSQEVRHSSLTLPAMEGSEKTGDIMPSSRKVRLLAELIELFEESSGLDLKNADPTRSFMDLGLDSLFLTQAALEVQNTFKVPVSFRQLMEDLTSLDSLAEHIDQQLPLEIRSQESGVRSQEPGVRSQESGVRSQEPEVRSQKSEVRNQESGVRSQESGIRSQEASLIGGEVLQQVIAQQLQIMARQLEMLEGRPPAPMSANGVVKAPGEPQLPLAVAEPAKPFGAAARINLKPAGLTPRQQQVLDDITRRYTARTRKSKEQTQANRLLLADPRVVSGFRPETKEMIYPIIVDRSQDSKLWDIDGNEYVDLTCGFGSCFFGHSPPFVVEALSRQLQQGYAIGPQHPWAASVASLISKLTGLPRVAFCNTGSEAVLGAIRVARTATGRLPVVMFNGAYHGINDEVVVRAGKSGKSLPAAAGIPPTAVDNVILLDYGAPASLRTIAERASELAAVVVEPVQSRQPDLQPREFLHELRQITAQAGTALIFDEVITGFRLQPGGAQAYFDVRADVATYGKVIGGGMPIGVIAGYPRFLDALDGGFWQYGDDSIPQAGVTYFAGTFVRHPLTLAAAQAVLEQLDRQGAALYDDLNARSARLIHTLNDWFAQVGAPLKLESCGSLFKVTYTQEQPLGDLLYLLLRLHGVHIWDARPCFLTTAHTDGDMARIVAAFQAAVLELQQAGFYPQARDGSVGLPDRPPQPGARLGKDPSGQPAWYLPDPQRPGKFLKIDG